MWLLLAHLQHHFGANVITNQLTSRRRNSCSFYCSNSLPPISNCHSFPDYQLHSAVPFHPLLWVDEVDWLTDYVTAFQLINAWRLGWLSHLRHSILAHQGVVWGGSSLCSHDRLLSETSTSTHMKAQSQSQATTQCKNEASVQNPTVYRQRRHSKKPVPVWSYDMTKTVPVLTSSFNWFRRFAIYKWNISVLNFLPQRLRSGMLLGETC